MNQRSFLASVAATGAALTRTSLWPEFAAEQAAAADGVPRGLLTGTYQAALKPAVEKIAITDDGLKHSWGDAVYRRRYIIFMYGSLPYTWRTP